MTVITLDPVFHRPPGAEAFTVLAPRPPSLNGKRIGILENRLANCEIFFDALAAELALLDELAGVVRVRKDSQSVPPTDAQWAELRAGADVVITGFGGCGSCSTRSMRDALDVEEFGLPAVCVVHSALVPAVRIIAGMAGQSEYPMVVVGYPHGPIAPWDKDEAVDTARAIAGAVRSCLVS
jgi:hypothetical protein